MGNPVPKRIATTIMNALKGGVVPRVGLEYIAVGRQREIEALLNDVSVIEDGGATFRFIVGKYGSGKSFLLQTLRNHAMERGFAVADADLAPDRRLVGTGGQGLNTYRELVKNLSVKTRPDGGALPLVIEKWLSGIQSAVRSETGLSPEDDAFSEEVEKRVHRVTGELEGMVNGFDFALVLCAYFRAYKDGDEGKKSDALRWFRGEYGTRREAKRTLGVSFIVDDDNWYDFTKLLAEFLVAAGYKGLILLIDELNNLFKLPNSVTRQYNYERILTMYNDALQGKARHIGTIMGGTPQSVEDARRGLFSYEALRSRLAEGRFAQPGIRNLLAPIIRIDPLTVEDMYVLLEHLSEIHAQLDGRESETAGTELEKFLQIEYGRIGAGENVTPREVIRDFIELLDLASQSGRGIIELMEGGGFEFSADTLSEPSGEAGDYLDVEV